MQRGKALNRFLDFFIGIPLLNLLASLKRRGVYPERPNRIGLLFNPALGDTLLASAAIQDVRALFPQAKLILFAASPNLAAAGLLPAIDVIEVLSLTRPLESIRVLRQNNLDLMLDFTAWQRLTAMFSLLSGARYKVGFERKKQYRHRGYDKSVLHRGDCHELENLRRLTRVLGSLTACAPRLVVPGGPLPQTVLQGQQIVVFHAWASGPQGWMREWPDENWASLAKQLNVPGRVFLLTGSPTDRTRCDSLCRRLVAQGTRAEVLVGRGGLGEVARALTHAELLVSVNTGIMHLGAILGVPTVSINGPTAARRWGPVGPRVANVCPDDGSGEFLDLGFEFRGKPRDTMQRIPVSDVLKAIYALCEIQSSSAEIDSVPAAEAEPASLATQLEEPGEPAMPLQMRAPGMNPL
jgi:ADP-heptose:LPS heptosyltransferase